MKEGIKISDAFALVGLAVGVPIVAHSADEITISSNGYTIRVAHHPQRLKGTYVTLQYLQSDEHALGHLIKFKGDPKLSESVLRLIGSDDFEELATLTLKYAVPYLLNQESDFAEFESFVAQEVKKMAARLPNYNFKATKWVRPEWPVKPN